MSAVIPASYREWRHCIEVACGVALAPAYIAARLSSLTAPADDATRRFASLYGEAHLHRIFGWFEQARAEAGAH